MPVIDFNMIRQKLTKARGTSPLKIAAFVLLSIISLLSINVFTHSGNPANQPDQEPVLSEETPAVELPAWKPYTPNAATSGKSLVYIKPDKVASVGQLLTFTIAADDADGDQIFYSASNLPDGSSFDADTQTFSWTPRYDQAGTYSVHFEVSDGELTDSEDITITVIQLYEDWDINGDGIADVLDMVLIGQQWAESGLTGWIREDTNEDGTINVLDIIVIGQHWTE
jgi:hypothetical protein